MSPFALALVLLCAFQIKHMLADFYWQTQWMVGGKGRYGHPGGLAHAGLHVALSAVILALAGVPAGGLAALLAGELAVHYHTDWAKEQALRRRGLGPTDKAYWGLTGLDQFIHQMTYLAMIALSGLGTVPQ